MELQRHGCPPATQALGHALSANLEKLFFEWLNKLILIKDIEGLLFSKFEMTPIAITGSEYQLKAMAFGELYDPNKHEASVDVKAATFSELVCQETEMGFEVGCVLDI